MVIGKYLKEMKIIKILNLKIIFYKLVGSGGNRLYLIKFKN